MTNHTKARCDGCGAEGRVFVQSGVRIGKRVVTWRNCIRCELEEQKLWPQRTAS